MRFSTKVKIGGKIERVCAEANKVSTCYEVMKGIVTKSTGSWSTVRGADGIKRECRVKGKFREDEIKSTNPVAVVDNVVFVMEKHNTGVIDTIETRKN